jgi:hypothetical protein
MALDYGVILSCSDLSIFREGERTRCMVGGLLPITPWFHRGVGSQE